MPPTCGSAGGRGPPNGFCAINACTAASSTTGMPAPPTSVQDPMPETIQSLPEPPSRRFNCPRTATSGTPCVSESMTVVGVTGTNGKTSTVEMTRQMWRMSGQRSASIGTLGVTTSDDQVKTGLTTPDIVTFLSNVAGLKRMGISHVAYEASSHGLDQHRCEGVPLAAAAFTNFSRDHLDYHGTMEAYRAAKLRLFQLLPDDWDQFEILMTNAIHRIPCLETAPVKLLLNGPESFTLDGNFLLGEGRLATGEVRSDGRGRHTTIPQYMPSAHRRYAAWTIERIRADAAAIGLTADRLWSSVALAMLAVANRQFRGLIAS